MASVFANRNVDGCALGYLNFYLAHLHEIAEFYYTKYPAQRKQLAAKFKDERFHFAARIVKTHPYAMPDFVLIMKMRGFIKQIIGELLTPIVDPPKPVQLELVFT